MADGESQAELYQRIRRAGRRPCCIGRYDKSVFVNYPIALIRLGTFCRASHPIPRFLTPEGKNGRACS